MQNYLLAVCELTSRIQVTMPSCSLLIILLSSSLMGALAYNCSDLTCPEDDSSGSGSDPTSEIYSLRIAKNTAGQVTVTLSHKTCNMNFSDPGPQWYRIEAVSDYTGAPAGNFPTPKIPDAFKCTGYITAVGFKPCEANVLDLPARYIWTRSPETSGKVCFKVNILPPGMNSVCQTLSACTTDLGSVSTEQPTIAPNTDATTVATTSSVVSTSTVPYNETTPSPSKVAKCLKNWPCTNSVQRKLCCSGGNTFASRCLMRRHQCLYDVKLECSKKKYCPSNTPSPTTPSPTTPPPTTLPPTTPPPPKYCIRNRPNNIRNGWKSQCRCDGNYKRRQCAVNLFGELECWCSTKDGYSTSDNKIIDCSSDRDPFDLDCY